MISFRFALRTITTMLVCAVSALPGQTGLTGNWAVRVPVSDGTSRNTYFNTYIRNNSVSRKIYPRTSADRSVSTGWMASRFQWLSDCSPFGHVNHRP